jgi:hypothetical protein
LAPNVLSSWAGKRRLAVEPSPPQSAAARVYGYWTCLLVATRCGGEGIIVKLTFLSISPSLPRPTATLTVRTEQIQHPMPPPIGLKKSVQNAEFSQKGSVGKHARKKRKSEKGLYGVCVCVK